MDEISFDDFLKVDIRVGKVTRAEPYPEARKPAIKMWIDFGADLGERKTSAQITAHYTPQELVGTKVLAVVNFPARQIGRFYVGGSGARGDGCGRGGCSDPARPRSRRRRAHALKRILISRPMPDSVATAARKFFDVEVRQKQTPMSGAEMLSLIHI